jgi:hypothetical protein
MSVEHAPNVNEIIKIVMPGIFVCTAFSALAARDLSAKSITHAGLFAAPTDFRFLGALGIFSFSAAMPAGVMRKAACEPGRTISIQPFDIILSIVILPIESCDNCKSPPCRNFCMAVRSE